MRRQGEAPESVNSAHALGKSWDEPHCDPHGFSGRPGRMDSVVLHPRLALSAVKAGICEVFAPARDKDGDDRAAQLPRQRHLRQGASSSTNCDHSIGVGDQYVPSQTETGGENDVSRRISFARIKGREHANRIPVRIILSQSCTLHCGGHYASQPTSNYAAAGLHEQSSHFACNFGLPVGWVQFGITDDGNHRAPSSLIHIRSSVPANRAVIASPRLGTHERLSRQRCWVNPLHHGSTVKAAEKPVSIVAAMVMESNAPLG